MEISQVKNDVYHMVLPTVNMKVSFLEQGVECWLLRIGKGEGRCWEHNKDLQRNQVHHSKEKDEKRGLPSRKLIIGSVYSLVICVIIGSYQALKTKTRGG